MSFIWIRQYLSATNAYLKKSHPTCFYIKLSLFLSRNNLCANTFQLSQVKNSSIYLARQPQTCYHRAVLQLPNTYSSPLSLGTTSHTFLLFLFLTTLVRIIPCLCHVQAHEISNDFRDLHFTAYHILHDISIFLWCGHLPQTFNMRLTLSTTKVLSFWSL